MFGCIGKVDQGNCTVKLKEALKKKKKKKKKKEEEEEEKKVHL